MDQFDLKKTLKDMQKIQLWFVTDFLIGYKELFCVHELIYCSINNFSLVSLDFSTCLLGDIKNHFKIFTDTTIFEI